MVYIFVINIFFYRLIF